jgi:hypothetical protein
MFSEKAGEPEHNHKVEVDGEGTGQTISTSDGPVHTHKIENWVMAPSKGMKDRGDEHVHHIDHQSVAGYDMQNIPKVDSPAGKPHVQIQISVGPGPADQEATDDE